MVQKSKIQLDEDMRLMLMVARDDKTAYSKLYRKYFTIITKYIMRRKGLREPPEDLAQEVFVRVWQNRSTYRPDATVKTFLFGYAKNILHEKQSLDSKKAVLDFRSFSNLTLEQSQLDFVRQKNDIIKSIKKQIAALPDKQRQTFETVYISGYSIAKAAKILQCSPQSIYNNLFQVRKKLCKLIGQPLATKEKLSRR